MPKANESEKTTQPPASGDEQTGNAQAKAKQVEVVCEGRLGRLLLKKGDKTSEPDYVALIRDPRGLVQEVK